MTTEPDTERVARICHTGLIRDAADLDAWVRQAPDDDIDLVAYRRAVDEVFGKDE